MVCLLQKNSTRDETILKLTNNLIQEQLSYLLDTKQPRTTLPKTIHDLLCSQACHGKLLKIVVIVKLHCDYFSLIYNY